MQVLKATVKNAILKAALEEFCKKGYKKASIRSIAERSQTTPGNMYRYFDSKGTLFTALVSPVFQKIIELLDLAEQRNKVGIDEVDTALIHRFIEVCNEHPRELGVLIHGSEGSPFEKGMEKINKAMEKMVLEHWECTSLAEEDLKLQQALASAKCRSMVMGITIVLQSQLKAESMKKALYIYIQGEAQTLFISQGEEGKLPS